MLKRGRIPWCSGWRGPFFFLGTLCFGVLMAAGELAANTLVVIEAFSTDSFEVGSVVDGAQPIQLGEDAEISLVNQAGQKITITGPFRGTIDDKLMSGSTSAARPGSRDIVAVLSKALKRNADQATSLSLAALRSIKLSPEDIWVVNLDQGRNHCLPPGAKPMLWHPRGSRAGFSWLRRDGTDARAAIAWKPGRETTAWPKDVALTAGALYIAGGKGGRVAQFAVHHIPADLPTRAHRAAWMVERGCNSQAMRLLMETPSDHQIGAGAR